MQKIMINNLLKVVGVEGSTSPNDSVSSSHHGAQSPNSSTHYSDYEGNNGNNNNLASTIGGFLNNFQETFQLDGKAVVAGALDSTTGAMGVMNHKSWNKGAGGGGSGGGRYKNAGGRGYYTDGANANRTRRKEVAVQQHLAAAGSMGDASYSNSRSGNQKQRGLGSNTAINNGIYQGRKMVSDIGHLYQVVDDRQAYENYDTLMEITSNAATEATARMSSYSDHSTSDNSSVGSNARRGRRGSSRASSRGGSRDSSQEQKQNWARMKEEELMDRMLSQFPVSALQEHTSFAGENRCRISNHVVKDSC